MASADQATAFPLSLQGFISLSTGQKLGILAVLALSIALLVGVWSWSRTPDYSVLFSNVSERDGGEIIDSLQQMNVPYRFAPGGGSILVPASQVHETRLKLASQGLPKGGLVGFEVMETQKLGASQFLEQVNYQRALEGELARSIQSLSEVRGARVHLAIPKQSAFLRDEQKPTASVLLNLSPGRTLEPNQIAGIIHLVSSSVAQLTPANVSVIDQNGNLISQVQDSLRNTSLDPTQFKYLRELEASYIKRIETILEPVVGPGNVRAQVAANVDFSQTDQMAESYKPNPSTEAAIRSQQTAETSTSTAGASGVPGALSNQPPVPATAPITAPAVGGSQAGGSQQPSSRNATVNYELDKTIKHTKGASGTIKRLSVAVVINNKLAPPDKDGKIKSVPLSAAEMKQMTDLVREAMGFSTERGDTLNVANASFTPSSEKEVIPETPLWKDPEVIAMARESLKYLAVALVAFFLWSRMVKPLIAQLIQKPPVVEESMGLAEEIALESNLTAISQREHFDAKLASVREMAKNEPKVAANIIKDWVGGNQ